MEEQEENGMDTTYVGIMLVVFLVLAALAVDIGYMYVSEDDLHSAAETSALAGAGSIRKRIHSQALKDGSKIDEILHDQSQKSARDAVAESVSGEHKAAALIEIINNGTNRLSEFNDITVGFWNMSSRSYIPGGTPVNAVQVRTRRTAESETVGLGSMGRIIAEISGPTKHNYTPDAIAAFPPRADANFTICSDGCDPGCTYPKICRIPERKLNSEQERAAGNFAYTTLSYSPGGASSLSDLICMEMPPQDVCGKEVFTIRDASGGPLRDIESMMYNSNAEKDNKDYDDKGILKGWWVVAPVTACPSARQENVFEKKTVTGYALVRISRVCAAGSTGCRQNGTAFDAPAGTCAEGENGLYIDHISCIGCNSKDMIRFPGLHPVLVK